MKQGSRSRLDGERFQARKESGLSFTRFEIRFDRRMRVWIRRALKLHLALRGQVFCRVHMLIQGFQMQFKGRRRGSCSFQWGERWGDECIQVRRQRGTLEFLSEQQRVFHRVWKLRKRLTAQSRTWTGPIPWSSMDKDLFVMKTMFAKEEKHLKHLMTGEPWQLQLSCLTLFDKNLMAHKQSDLSFPFFQNQTSHPQIHSQGFKDSTSYCWPSLGFHSHLKSKC